MWALTVVAPIVRFNALDIFATPTFLRASDFNSRTSDGVHARLEEIFRELLMLGTKAPDDMVSAVHFALVTFERNPVQHEGPKMVSAGNYIIDYRGYEITYQSPPMFPNRWVVNLSSTSPHLVNRLGRGNIIIEDMTLEAAVDKAKRYVDGLR